MVIFYSYVNVYQRVTMVGVEKITHRIAYYSGIIVTKRTVHPV